MTIGDFVPPMSSPETKKPSTVSLPEELLLSCVARVPRLYYPTLSLVSKSFRSLLTSSELYKVRSSLGITETCLYVCLDDLNHGCRWFALCRKPNSSGYVLATIPFPNCPAALSSSLVAVGSDIYNIAAMRYSEPSSKVSILDCWSHTSREGPSLNKKLRPLSASVVDRKIYLVGSYGDGMENLVHVFDTKTQIWDPEPISCREIQGYLVLGSACLDGKFYVRIEREVAGYDSVEGRWELDGPTGDYMLRDCHCVIDNVLYSLLKGKFRWYDAEGRMWRDLEGLVGVGPPEFPPNGNVKLADYGGKMAVLWYQHKSSSDGYMTVIWFAEIALERRSSCEIWGKVEWFDQVLTDPKFFEFVKVLAVTV